MKDGDLIRNKKRYLIERFSTKEGLIDFFIGTFIFGYTIVKYKDLIFNKIRDFIPTNGFIGDYISYLVFGIVLTILGLIISTIIIKVSNMLGVTKE